MMDSASAGGMSSYFSARMSWDQLILQRSRLSAWCQPCQCSWPYACADHACTLLWPASQDVLFQYFMGTMDALVEAAKSEGKFDRGPVALSVTHTWIDHKRIIHREAGTGAAPCLPVLWRLACVRMQHAWCGNDDASWPLVA